MTFRDDARKLIFEPSTQERRWGLADFHCRELTYAGYERQMLVAPKPGQNSVVTFPMCEGRADRKGPPIQAFGWIIYDAGGDILVEGKVGPLERYPGGKDLGIPIDVATVPRLTFHWAEFHS